MAKCGNFNQYSGGVKLRITTYKNLHSFDSDLATLLFNISPDGLDATNIVIKFKTNGFNTIVETTSIKSLFIIQINVVFYSRTSDVRIYKSNDVFISI